MPKRVLTYVLTEDDSIAFAEVDDQMPSGGTKLILPDGSEVVIYVSGWMLSLKHIDVESLKAFQSFYREHKDALRRLT